jgi:ParB family chromosome partitioning protein
VEELVRGKTETKTKNTTSADSGVSNELNKLQSKLVSHFGTKVSIKANNHNKGEIKIPFASADDLNRILEILEV